MFGTILLAVDGSSSSEKAVQLTRQLAAGSDDEVVVAHVSEFLPAPFQTYYALDKEEFDKAATDLAKRYLAELEDAGIKARIELRSAQFGGVPGTLIDPAEDQDAGLIVMGSHGPW